MKAQIMKPVFEDSIKGRITRPSKSLDDPDFKYVPAIRTDLRETNKRAREALRLVEGGRKV